MSTSADSSPRALRKNTLSDRLSQCVDSSPSAQRPHDPSDKKRPAALLLPDRISISLPPKIKWINRQMTYSCHFRLLPTRALPSVIRSLFSGTASIHVACHASQTSRLCLYLRVISYCITAVQVLNLGGLWQLSPEKNGECILILSRSR